LNQFSMRIYRILAYVYSHQKHSGIYIAHNKTYTIFQLSSNMERATTGGFI
ncbi:MAG: hypothetical protein QG588_1700, partial [Candidatus Poribacteria bacterium]|nr:hypothetical protein [Candidatus Poribacteria bacterium]